MRFIFLLNDVSNRLGFVLIGRSSLCSANYRLHFRDVFLKSMISKIDENNLLNYSKTPFIATPSNHVTTPSTNKREKKMVKFIAINGRDKLQ